MKLVMFDIDGTLTQTYQADETCFVQALQEVFGFTDINTDWASYPHCSDSGILEALFQLRLGRSPLRTEISTFHAHFVSLLTAAIAVQPFNPLPVSRDCLRSLTTTSAFALSLRSAAWERSASINCRSTG